jgi:hypothetical protein
VRQRPDVRGRFFLGKLLLVLVALLVPSMGVSQDAAILWDVSGSISDKTKTPAYTEALRNSVAEIVTGRGVDRGLWRVTAPDPLPAELKIVLDGGRAVYGSGDQIVVIRFGHFRRHEFPDLPYFPWKRIDASSQDVRAQLVAQFPADARDDKTNKDLAISAAARYFYEQKRSQWYLVTISDFNEDSVADLNPAEAQIVDDFNAGRIAQQTRPLVLRWNRDPRIQVRIEFDRRNVAEQAVSPARPRVIELIAPKSNAEFKNGRPPTFSWLWQDPEDVPKRYTVIVTEIGGNGRSFRKSASVTSATMDQTLSTGKYSWQVFAELNNGETVQAGPRPFVVASSGGLGWGFLVFLAAVALVVGAWIYTRKKSAIKTRSASA